MMLRNLTAILSVEILTLSRSRRVIVSVALMVAFSLLIAFAGSAPVGTVGTDRLTVTVASLATLLVYLVPLTAFAISYDSISGEASRGTLALLLSYPATRFQLLLGKSLAQLLVVVFATSAGIGSATLLVAATDNIGMESAGLAVRLAWSTIFLGAVFVAVGNCVSATTREPGTAAAIAIAIWIVTVVMYDVGLLAALVNDGGGRFTEKIFPWLLVASPTDAFRLFNLSQIDAGAAAGGMASVLRSAPVSARFALASLLLWPVLAGVGATFLFRRYQP